MHFTKSLLVCASFVAATLAQTPIRFTQTPASGTVGVPTTLIWTGGDGVSTVNIDLKQNGVKVVTVLQRNAQGTSFAFTPPSAGTNFVLTISQGTTSSDSAPFNVVAASASSSSSSASSSSSSASSTSSTSRASTSSSSSTSSSVAAVSTSTVVTSTTRTTIVSVGTILPSSSANGTFVSQTLTATAGSASTAGSANTSGARTSGTTTGSAPIATAAASTFGASLLLALGAAAAFALLN